MEDPPTDIIAALTNATASLYYRCSIGLLKTGHQVSLSHLEQDIFMTYLLTR